MGSCKFAAENSMGKDNDVDVMISNIYVIIYTASLSSNYSYDNYKVLPISYILSHATLSYANQKETVIS